MKLKLIIVKKLIPQNTFYCYTFKGRLKNGIGYKIKSCPYWKLKYNKEWGTKAEYCTYLKEFLSIQDQVKDCGINEYEARNNE